MDAVPAAILAGDKRALSGVPFPEDKHRLSAPHLGRASVTQASNGAGLRPSALVRPLPGTRQYSIYHRAGSPICQLVIPIESLWSSSSPVPAGNGRGPPLLRLRTRSEPRG